MATDPLLESGNGSFEHFKTVWSQKSVLVWDLSAAVGSAEVILVLVFDEGSPAGLAVWN